MIEKRYNTTGKSYLGVVMGELKKQNELQVRMRMLTPALFLIDDNWAEKIQAKLECKKGQE